MNVSSKRIIACILSTVTLLSTVFSPSVFAENNDSVNDAEPSQDQSDDTDDQQQLPVVYVKDGGSDSNDGKTDKTAFATIGNAFSALSQTGGTVVVCGKLTLSDDAASLPSHQHDIDITSYYDGTDYRSHFDAELYFDESLYIFGPGKTTFFGIKLHSQKSASIYCNGSNVVFGSKIENVSDAGTSHSLYGGKALVSTNAISDGNFSDFTLQVDSGIWNIVTLGNLRKDKYAPYSTISNASLIINGGTFLAKDTENNTSSLVSGANISNSLSLEITGGIFYGSFYIVGSEGPISPYTDLKYNANIKVTISNGIFMGEYIKALCNRNAKLYGTYDFAVLGGSFSSLTYISCENVYSDINLSSFDAIQSKLYGFEKVVYVDPEKGDDKNGGENPSSAMATLSNAITSLVNGGVIVLCGEYSLPDGFTMTYNDHPIIITAKYLDSDFASTNNAKLKLTGSIYIPSSVTFDNIQLSSSDNAELIFNGSELSFTETCATEGEIGIKVSQSEKTHSLNIHSGMFSFVELGPSDILTSFSISNGSVKSFRFNEEGIHTGDVLLDLSGGSIDGSIDLSQYAFNGNIELILKNTQFTGNITAPAASEGKVCEALVIDESKKDSLVGFDIITDKYVFVKDGAKGDGSTPSHAAGDILTAYTLAGLSNASVVFCGPYTHIDSQFEGNVGVLTYSNLYRGIDYSSLNDASLTLAADFCFYNDATVKDITIKTIKPDTSFRCNSHIVIFDYGITCKTSSISADYYPSIYAAETLPAMPFNEKGESVSDKITLKGGTWFNIYSSAATNINGSIIMGSVFGTEDLSNNCSIVVSNGIIYGGIYASKAMKANCTSDATISFNGGEIHGYISPSYFSTSGYKGKFKINIKGGDFSAVEKFVGPEHVGAEKFYADIDVTYDKEAGMDAIYSYNNPISADHSSVQFFDNYWYMFTVNDDKLVIKRSISLMSIRSYQEPYAVIETGSSILDMSVTEANNKLYIFVRNIFNGTHRTRIYSSKNSNNSITFDFITDIERDDIVSPCLYLSEGRMHLYYSKMNEDGGYDIYGVILKDNMQFGTDPIKLLSATERWEQGVLGTPKIFTADNGTKYLIYTGGDVYKSGSMIGIAKINDSTDLLNSAVYEKGQDPIFYENDTHTDLILGSLITIDGNEPYLVFNSNINGENVLVMQSFSYDNEGVPYFSTPCDISMQFIAFNKHRSFDSILEGYDINVKANVDTQSVIKPPFSFRFLKTEHFIIITCGLVGILLVVAIVLIKKFIRSPDGSTLKRGSVNKTKLYKKHAKRRSGKIYAAYLEQTIKTESTQTQGTNSVTEATETDNTIEDPSILDEQEEKKLPSNANQQISPEYDAFDKDFETTAEIEVAAEENEEE